MVKDFASHLREFINERNQLLVSRNMRHVKTPERLLVRANRRTKKEIELATILLKSLGGHGKLKESEFNSPLTERPCLQQLSFSNDQSDYYLIRNI